MQVARLTKRADFVSVSRQGQSRVCPAFVLLYKQVEEGGANSVRLGFTASKKIGNAVQRNRARRRLKAASDNVMRLNENFAGPAMDLVLVARHKVLTIDFSQLEQDLANALQALGYKTSV